MMSGNACRSSIPSMDITITRPFPTSASAPLLRSHKTVNSLRSVKNTTGYEPGDAHQQSPLV